MTTDHPCLDKMKRVTRLGVCRPNFASLTEFPWQPQVRFYGAPATTEPTTPVIKITHSILLQKATVVDKAPKERPLVLLLSWLAAKQCHLDKFANIYLSRGCDVLTVKTRPMQLLLPKVGAKVVARDVVNFLQSKEQRDRKILVHGFSVGAYLYGEILQRVLASKTESREITNRIIAQVWDSAVDVQNLPIGVSRAVFQNRLVQKSVQTSLDAYMRVMHSAATVHYHKSSYIFHHNPVSAPSLFFYSRTDPVGTAEDNERAMASLTTIMGYDHIYSKVFDNSPHVSHMYKHKDEYLSSLKGFLTKIEYFCEVAEEHKELTDFVRKEEENGEEAVVKKEAI